MKNDEFKNDLFKQINSENIDLPDSLSKEKMVMMVKGRRQEEKKINYKKFVRIAAMFVIITVAVVIGVKTYEPGMKPIENDKDEQVYTVDDYKEIEDFFIGMRNDFINNNHNFFQLESSGDFNIFNQSAGSSASGTNNGSSSSSQESKEEYSKTNLQVKTVDEADIVKNDGKYLYVVDSSVNSSVYIISSQNPSQLQKTAEIKIKFNDEKAGAIENLYIKDDVMIVIVKGIEAVTYDTESAVFCGSSVNDYMAVIYDISDRFNPKETKRYALDGNGVSSRLIDNNLILVSNYTVTLYKENKDLKQACIPSYYVNDNQYKIDADKIHIINGNEENTYTVLLSVNIEKEVENTQAVAVLGGSDQIYCNDKSLYVSKQVYEPQEDGKEIYSLSQVKTGIYAFDFDDGLKYRTSCTVDGDILNQFSMDEFKGYFRIATTQRNTQSIITVLDQNLEQVGKLDGIAKGESIYAVRFMEDTAYVVTFYQTDPLFVIDLTNPTAPEISGEVKIPGFSNMLYPLNSNQVVGIGQDGDDNSANRNVKISLFDISDKTKPVEISKVVFQGGGTTPAQYEHKAFTLLNNDNEFAIPVNWDNNTQNYICTLKANENKLEVLQKYTTSTSAEVIRCAFSGNAIFAVSNGYLTAFDRTSGNIISTLSFYS